MASESVTAHGEAHEDETGDTLLQALEGLSQLRDREGVMRLVRRTAQELTGCDSTALWLGEPASDGAPDVELWAAQRSTTERVPLVVVDAKTDPRVPHGDGARAVRALCVVPLLGREPVGALGCSWSSPHALDPAELRKLEQLARFTAVVLENLSLYGELEQRVNERTAELQKSRDAIHKLAITDELTGLCNRRGFYVLAEQELKHATRRKKPCVLLFMDLDGLKAVNDAHGHDTGDSLLSATADVLRQTFRHSDVIGRTGGDEFCVLALDSCEGNMVRSRLLEHVARWNQTRMAPFELSASLGIVDIPGGTPEKLDELLARADQAMYIEKRQRGMSRSSTPPSLPPTQTSPPSGSSSTTNTTVYCPQAPPGAR